MENKLIDVGTQICQTNLHVIYAVVFHEGAKLENIQAYLDFFLPIGRIELFDHDFLDFVEGGGFRTIFYEEGIRCLFKYVGKKESFSKISSLKLVFEEGEIPR